MSEEEMEKNIGAPCLTPAKATNVSEKPKDHGRSSHSYVSQRQNGSKPQRGRGHYSGGYQSQDRKSQGRGYRSSKQRDDVIDQLPDQLVKGKKVDITHLLDFQYRRAKNADDVYSHGYSPRTRNYPRRSMAVTKLKLEQYLHANCQFIVKKKKKYIEHNIDPDKLVDWDNIEQVRINDTEIPSCPICLHAPIAGKITKCGHIYCWSCILHFISLDTTSWVDCPVCKAPMNKGQLKSFEPVTNAGYEVGDKITMRLMKREKGTLYSMPIAEWSERFGELHDVQDSVSTCFNKLLTASPDYIKQNIISRERQCLQQQLLSAEPSEICFIEQALTLLNKREAKLDKDSPRTSISDASVPNSDEGAAVEGVSRSRTASRTESHSSETSAVSTSGLSTANTTSVCSDSNHSEDVCVDINQLDSTPVGLPSDARVDSTDTAVAAAITEIASVHLELPPEVREAEDNSKRKNARAPQPQSTRFFYFYQAKDGQHMYMDSINSRCLAHEYGSLENAPSDVTARIEAIQTFTVTEELRKRHRYLNHMPLSCQFRVVELKLEAPLVSKDTLFKYKRQIDARRQERMRKQRVDRQHNRRAQKAIDKMMGKFPEMRYNTESDRHFPSMRTSASETDMYDMRRSESSVDEPIEAQLSPDVSEDLSPDVQTTGSFVTDSSTPSYSQMLRQKESVIPRTVTWPALHSARDRPENSVAVASSDDEQSSKLPNLQQAWAIDLQALSQPTCTNDSNDSGARGKKKKGKKKEKRLLFSTEMRACRQ